MNRFHDTVDIFGILAIAKEMWHIIVDHDYTSAYMQHITYGMAVAFEKDPDVFNRDEFTAYFEHTQNCMTEAYMWVLRGQELGRFLVKRRWV